MFNLPNAQPIKVNGPVNAVGNRTPPQPIAIQSPVNSKPITTDRDKKSDLLNGDGNSRELEDVP